PPGHPAHWLAIDPKPMLGDPAYDVWPLVSQIGSPFADHAAGPFTVMHQRVQLAAAALGVPGLRIAQWGLARTVEAVLWQRETFPATATVASAEEQLQLRVWHWLAGYCTAPLLTHPPSATERANSARDCVHAWPPWGTLAV